MVGKVELQEESEIDLFPCPCPDFLVEEHYLLEKVGERTMEAMMNFAATDWRLEEILGHPLDSLILVPKGKVKNSEPHSFS